MKCQTCPKLATYHITELLGSERWEEFHLCEKCARKHLSAETLATPAALPISKKDDVSDLGNKQCEACGIKFLEFRNSGRLGCPHDYDSFQDELVPLLDNIHADHKHVGKAPKRLPAARAAQQELAALRRQLQTAITNEEYELAANTRDKIRQLEGG